MNNYQEKRIEEISERIIHHLEHGKTFSEIFELLPEYATELKELLPIITLLEQERNVHNPSEELFHQIITTINRDVTNQTQHRYTLVKEVPRRSSLQKINHIINSIHPMNNHWKIWAPLGAVVIIALIIIIPNQFKTKDSSSLSVVSNQKTSEAIPQQLPVATSQPATGDIDDVVREILASASDEEIFFNTATQDGELIAADSQFIASFNESYYENEF